MTFSFDYRTWNRSSVPSTTTWITVGIEEDAQDTALGENAGPYGMPTATAAGTADATLTAPTTPGDYRIFARLLAVLTADDALALYRGGFTTSVDRNYVLLGVLTVS